MDADELIIAALYTSLGAPTEEARPPTEMISMPITKFLEFSMRLTRRSLSALRRSSLRMATTSSEL
jgi:hypothetical protein